MKLSENIKSMCKNKNITLSELSKRSDVPLSTLYAWTTGRRSVNPHQVKKVAEILEISIHELLFGGEDPRIHSLQERMNQILDEKFEITIYEIKRRK